MLCTFMVEFQATDESILLNICIIADMFVSWSRCIKQMKLLFYSIELIIHLKITEYWLTTG